MAKMTTVPSPAPHFRPVANEEQQNHHNANNQQISQPITPLENTVPLSLIRTPKVNYNIVDTPGRSLYGGNLRASHALVAQSGVQPQQADEANSEGFD